MDQEAPTLSSCLLLIAGLLLVGFVIWLIMVQGPISWYLAGSLALLFIVRILAKLATERAEHRSTFWHKVSAGALEDTGTILRNLAIGAGIVLTVQLALNWYSADVEANTIGTLEQQIWDAVAALRPLGSLRVVAAIVVGALIISALMRSHLPTVLASKARKVLGMVATLLASLTMFTFVAVDAGNANYERLTGPIRAAIAVKLTETAAARKEAAAYRWIAQIVEKEQKETPERLEATRDYFAEGEQICDEYQRIYKEGVPIGTIEHTTWQPAGAGRVVLGAGSSSRLIRSRIDQLRDRDSPFGVIASSPLREPVKRSPPDDLCVKPEFFSDLAEHLAVFPTNPVGKSVPSPVPGAPVPPIETDAVTGDVRANPASEKRAGSDAVWLPDFSENITDRPVSTMEAAVSETDFPLNEATVTVEVKPARLDILRSLQIRADRASVDASATRAAMRTLATKSAAELISESFAIEGTAGKLVNALRDAVLAELAKRGEASLESWLRSAAHGEGVIARASNLMARTLFPELPLAEAVVAAGVVSRVSVKQIWDEGHPKATNSAEIRNLAREAVTRSPVRPPSYSDGGWKRQPGPRPRPRPIFRR